MKRWIVFAFVLMLGSLCAKSVLALGCDFTKEEIAAAGKHCVHGYWVNEQSVAFYAGETTLLNRELPKYLEGNYSTRQVVLHIGTKRVSSPWDTKPRNLFADWSVNSWDDPEDSNKAVPHFKLQIDVWLSSKITLESLHIPDGYEVVSGREIEQYIHKRKRSSK